MKLGLTGHGIQIDSLLAETPVNRYRPSRGEPIPLRLTTHPEKCPNALHARSKMSCNAPLETPAKSGRKLGDGRWKTFCMNCGFVYYDIE
jgi:hypothetical protein